MGNPPHDCGGSFVRVYGSAAALERGEPDAAVCVGCGAGGAP